MHPVNTNMYLTQNAGQPYGDLLRVLDDVAFPAE